MFCKKCGNTIFDNAIFCGNCGTSTEEQTTNIKPQNRQQISSASRFVYIILAICLGTLGIHNFYAGRIARGIGQLLLTIFIGWLIAPLLGIGFWVLIDICTVTSDGKGRPFQ